MGLNIRLVNDNLHERNVANLGVFRVLNCLGRRDQDIEFVASISHRQIAFDCHIEAIKAPFSQILHSFFTVSVMIDQRLQVCQPADKLFPDSQFAAGGNH